MRPSIVGLTLLTASPLFMACAPASSTECLPYEQFRIDGVIYYGPSEPIDASTLGDEVGEITKGLPASASDCVPFTLKDGQGTPASGSKVYEIDGIDPKDALAVAGGSNAPPRIFRTRATPP